MFPFNKKNTINITMGFTKVAGCPHSNKQAALPINPSQANDQPKTPDGYPLRDPPFQRNSPSIVPQHLKVQQLKKTAVQLPRW